MDRRFLGAEIRSLSKEHPARHAPRFDENLLGGVAVLEGTAYRVQTDSPSDALYSDLGDESVLEIPITLIPYYAWHNRGTTEMTVWMPLY